MTWAFWRIVEKLNENFQWPISPQLRIQDERTLARSCGGLYKCISFGFVAQVLVVKGYRVASWTLAKIGFCQ